MHEKNTKIIGIIIIIYALTWTIMLLVPFDLFTSKQNTSHLSFLDRWFILYRLTFQTSFVTILWLLLFGATRLTNHSTRLSRFVCNNAVIASLIIPLTLMYVYIMIAVSLNWISFSLNNLRSWHLPFTYVISPILVWTLFLLNKGKSPRKRNIIIIMIYPVAFFVLNMILGNTVMWLNKSGWPQGFSRTSFLCQDCLAEIHKIGWPAYSYFFLDPFFYPNIVIFILTIIGIFCVLVVVSYLRIILKQKQLIENEINTNKLLRK